MWAFRPGKSLGRRDKKIVALHEIGHALCVVDGEGNPVSRDKAVRPFEKVTCAQRGESALGYVINLPGEDKHLRTKGRPGWPRCAACLADGPRRS